jgi:hypothetical protein
VSAPREVWVLIDAGATLAVTDDAHAAEKAAPHWAKDRRPTVHRYALAAPPAVGVVATDIVRAAVSDAIARELQVADDLRHDTAARRGAARKAQAMKEWLAAAPPAVDSMQDDAEWLAKTLGGMRGPDAVEVAATTAALSARSRPTPPAALTVDSLMAALGAAHLYVGVSMTGSGTVDERLARAVEQLNAPDTSDTVWVDAETMAALEAMQTLHRYSSHPAALSGEVFDAHVARCRVAPEATP